MDYSNSQSSICFVVFLWYFSFKSVRFWTVLHGFAMFHLIVLSFYCHLLIRQTKINIRKSNTSVIIKITINLLKQGYHFIFIRFFQTSSLGHHAIWYLQYSETTSLLKSSLHRSISNNTMLPNATWLHKILYIQRINIFQKNDIFTKGDVYPFFARK